MNIQKIRFIFNDIFDMLDNNLIYEIQDKYEQINKNMLNYIKTKNRLYFKYLFDLISFNATKDTTKEEYIKLFVCILSNVYIEFNIYLKSYIIELLCDIMPDVKEQDETHIIHNIPDEKEQDITHINELQDILYIDEQDETCSDEFLNDNIEFDVSITNEFFRKNQRDAIAKMKEQKYSSGIHSQIMGAGKSYILLNTIYEHYRDYKQNKIYIILTEKIEILQKWFVLPDGSWNHKIFNDWKQKNIIDIDLFDIKENFNIKSKVNLTIQKKPIIYICNNAYLKAQNRYLQINVKTIALILVDECHSINTGNFTMLEYYKNNNISIIGFSATPIRPDKTSKNNILKIYSKNNKINLISNYTLIDALRDNIVLPFKHYILKPIDKHILTDEFIKCIYDKYIINNNDLPYKKGIGWTKNIVDIKDGGNIYTKIKKIFKKFKIMRSYSGKDGINNIDTFYDTEMYALLLCINRCKEGSDIKHLDFGILLDNVKNRSINVWLQMAGRLMRPDKDKRKKYATIIECMILDNTKEIITVGKIISYYDMILNMSAYDIEDINNKELLVSFDKLYKNTYVNTKTNQIEIDLTGDKKNCCIIKFDDTTIDWSIFKNFLFEEVNKRKGINNEQFNNTIKKIKVIDIFSQDVHFWDEYDKLDHSMLNILSSDELKKYTHIWTVKTWYDVLNIYDKLSYDELSLFFVDKGFLHITQDIYMKMSQIYNNIPKYPEEYYKYTGWINYQAIIIN